VAADFAFGESTGQWDVGYLFPLEDFMLVEKSWFVD